MSEQRGFPMSPAPYAKTIIKQFPRSFYSEDDSWDLTKKLDLFLLDARKMIKSAQWAEAQALLRGFATVVLELMEYADDSFGVIGQTFDEGFGLYLDLPPVKTGITDEVYFKDLIELVVFEDYGLTGDAMKDYFKQISKDQGDFCIHSTRRYMSELQFWDLDHQVDECLTLLGKIAAEQRRFDEFESLAQEMGAEHWERIILIADAAVKQRKHALAERVLETALATGRGWHLDLLQRKLEQLKQGRWNPDPKK